MTSARAHATLQRGAGFLTHLASHAALAAPWPAGHGDAVRARFTGNCLAELDRFLHVLMDNLARDGAAPALRDERHTGNRLGRLAGAHWDPAPDQARLNALGRSRACLKHCQGLVRRADRPDGDAMTAGWSAAPSPLLQRYALGDRLTPTGAALVEVSAFYAQLGDRLVRLG